MGVEILIIVLLYYLIGVLLAYIFMGLVVYFYFNKYSSYLNPPDGFYWLSVFCIACLFVVVICDLLSKIKITIIKPEVVIERIVKLFKKK